MSLIQTTPEWRLQRGREYLKLIGRDVRARKEWEQQRIVARNLYYGNFQRLDTHWEGASDIHFPVVYDKIETIVPKMHNAFWNVEPLVIVNRTPDDYDPQGTEVQQQFINWALTYDIPDLFTTMLSWFRNMLIDGVGVVKTSWRLTWRNTAEVHRLKTHWRKGEILPSGYPAESPVQKGPDDMMDELFGPGAWKLEDIKDAANGNTEARIRIVEDRRHIPDIRVQFLKPRAGKESFVDEIEVVVFRPIIVQDSPHVETVAAEDLIVPRRTRNLQTADRVVHRHWMRPDEILRMANDSQFDPWILDKQDREWLESVRVGEQFEEQLDNRDLELQKDSVEGIDDSKDMVDPENQRLLCFEVYACIDIDNDGQREEVVMQIVNKLKKVVHITYLDVIHPHGRRPFSPLHYLAPDDRFYQPGLAWFLAPLNVQVNTTINQVNDRQELINNPIFFFQPVSMINDSQTLQNIPPGTGIPMNNPSGVVFPDWGKAPLADLSIMQATLSFADMVSLSPMAGGNLPPQNPPRTARGTLALISEGNIKTDILIGMAQREGLKEMLRQVFGLYSTYMPDEKHYWATGKDRVKHPEMMARKLMRGQFEFTFKGNTSNTNPAIQQGMSEIRYQIASLNPLYMQDPVKFRELLRDFLTHHSPTGTDVQRLLPDLPGMGAELSPPRTQEQEIMAMRMHQRVAIHPSDNDLEHMMKLQKFVDSPAFEDLDPAAVALIATHFSEHQQAQARKQQMAALQQQTAGGGEQSVPADAGMGNYEGGVA